MNLAIGNVSRSSFAILVNVRRRLQDAVIEFSCLVESTADVFYFPDFCKSAQVVPSSYFELSRMLVL